MRFHAYLIFDGDCAEAFRHYAEVLDGELEIMTHADSPAAADVPESWGDRVLHAALKVGDQMLMASDAPPEHYDRPAGTHVSVTVDDPREARRIFEALAPGAKIEMPFEKTFWSPGFGMLVDRWGTPWMVNTETPTEWPETAESAEAVAR